MRHLSTALLAGLLLAGCSGDDSPEPVPDEAFEENFSGTVADEPSAPLPEPAPLPSEAPAAETNTADLLPPPAAIEPDAQVIEDADATGMTARVRRDDADADAAATQPPAEGDVPPAPGQ